MSIDPKELHEQLLNVLQKQDEGQLHAALADAEPADVAEILELLEDVERSRVIFALESAAAAELITLLDERVRDEVVDDLPGDRLAEMVTEMSPDDAADVVGELTTEETHELLERLPVEQSEEIEQLLKYDENTAGGLMNPHVLSMPQLHTVGEAIEYLRRADIDSEVFQIYTTDHDGRLSGTVSPHRLLISPAKKLISDLMEPVPTDVTVEEDQEVVVHLFRKYDLTSMPVVDDDGKLVGHITVDDVLDVAAEEADEDIYHMAGTDAAELESSSTLRRSGIRLAFLLPSFVFLAGTAGVLLFAKSYFDEGLMLAIVAFVPMIGALAGCCSVQTSTIITRGLATGEYAATQVRLAFRRESGIALVLAPCCAVIAWLLVCFEIPMLLSDQEILDTGVSVTRIANAVALGMLVGIGAASILGISMPFLFRRLGIDPAIAAGPIVTAMNDVLCVTIYFALTYLVVNL